MEEGCSSCVLSFDVKPFSSVSTSNWGGSGLLHVVLALFPWVTAKDWKLVSHPCNGMKSQSLIHALNVRRWLSQFFLEGCWITCPFVIMSSI